MTENQPKKGKFLEGIAEENGVAVAILDERSRETAVANNNSICGALWDSAAFGPRCAEFCGKAFANTANGGPFDFECHAGLTCRAVPVEDKGRRFVAIVGRTFTKSENYRKATEKAISGEWKAVKPTDFFENILMSGSTDGIDKASEKLSRFMVREPDDILEIEPKPATETDELSEMVRRFHEEAAVETPVQQPAKVEVGPSVTAAEFRSLVGNLMHFEYREACAAVLGHLQSRYNFGSVIWFERRDDQFSPLLSRGELRDKPIRINLSPDNTRIIESAEREKPLVLRERREKDPEHDTRTLSLFPTKVGREIRCALAISGETDDTQAIEVVRVLKAVAPQIEILRLRQEVATRDTLASGLKRFNESLGRVDADDFWMKVTQTSAELLGAERASLLVLDEAENKLTAKAAIGSAIDLNAAENIGSRVARHVIERGLPVTVADLPNIGVESAPLDWRYKSSSFISFPIAIGDRNLAVMNFTDRAGGDAFTDRDLELLNVIAPQIAVAIDRTKFKTKASEFEQRSVTDALTGLRNRGYLEERLTEEISQARRYRSSMCLLMIDVDNFKSYNDSFGHPAGDTVLKLVSGAFRETLRTADVAARYGGEEFAILLPHTASDEAAAIAERIRKRIEHTNFPERKVTISIGIASYSNEFEEPKDWITAADMALYEAKHHGRNNIRIYENLGRSFREKIN